MAPVAARAALESLLRTRKLDSTLTTALPLVPHPDDVVASGIASLDVHLHGGLPRGQLSEVIGPRSSGRTSLVHQALADVTRRGELVAVIDTLDRWDPAGLAERGADLARVLWIRGLAFASGFGAAGSAFAASGFTGRRCSQMAQALDRAIKAVSLVLHARGFGLVVLDIADVPVAVVRELPFTTWMRLQRVLEGSSTACVVVATEPLARSAGGLSIRLESSRPPHHGREETTFHAGVKASRRPFIRARVARLPAGRWVGQLAARRLSGVASEATVVRAHRSLQTTDRIGLSFGT
jgi:recombination protein RecA